METRQDSVSKLLSQIKFSSDKKFVRPDSDKFMKKEYAIWSGPTEVFPHRDREYFSSISGPRGADVPRRGYCACALADTCQTIRWCDANTNIDNIQETINTL